MGGNCSSGKSVSGCGSDDDFAEVRLNQDRHRVRRGVNPPGRGPVQSTWTGFTPGEQWYCGRSKGECRCGGCDSRCGPTSGCPCASCHKLKLADEGAEIKYNAVGDHVWKGGRKGGDGGATDQPPSELWYCGRKKDQCR